MRFMQVLLWQAGMMALFGAATVSAQTPSHPLDALTADEYKAVVEILKNDGKTSDSSRYPYVTLETPDKQWVKAWKDGEPIPRKAHAVIKEGVKSYEAIVDLTEKQVDSYEQADGEPMVMFEEFIGAAEIVLKDERMIEGLAKRGITDLEKLFCLPLTAGRFGTPEEEGKRLMKVPCYVLHGGSNWYSMPIEGLFGIVDLNSQSVVDVVDTGVIPVSEDPWGYAASDLKERFGVLASALNPAEITQAQGASFQVKGYVVTWDMWKFHYRIDKRPGIILDSVEVNDGGRMRSILYEAHLSEVFVPYMNPDQGWYWRTYMDSGEYGFGVFLSPLKPGVDCPRNAVLQNATLAGDDGEPYPTPPVVCIFERNIGDPAWRHYEVFAEAHEGRPATELVVRTASEVGNYDYLIDYIFQQDGTLRIAVGATGLDAVQGAAAKSMSDPSAEQDTQYGSLIAPNLVAPNHDHYFNFRLDFDIDGTANDFMKAKLVSETGAEGWPRRSLWKVAHEMPKTESAATSKLNPAAPAMYHIVNHSVKSALDHHPSYMLSPGGSYIYGQLSLDDPPVHRNAYIDNHVWVTPYDRDELYAGGKFAMQSDGSDTLAQWVKQDRSIENTDIVLWYTAGIHHVPRMEDWPVMPTHWSTVKLMPFNFFSHNPAIDIPAPKD